MDLQSKLAQAIAAAAAEKPRGEIMSGFRSKHMGGGDFNEETEGRSLTATVVPPIKGAAPATFAVQMRKAF